MAANKNKDRHTWRTGYTTGSSAAGAAKAACALLRGDKPSTHTEIPLPDSTRLTLPIYRQELDYPVAKAGILKDGGDDPDVTHGIEIMAIVRFLSAEGEVHLYGGNGVGIVTKKGLAVPVGESAINPVPRQMIIQAVREIFPRAEIEIRIEVPQGEEIAKRTLNAKLGIIGGISILGTSGIVRPMSEEAFKTSLLPELDQAIAYGHRTVVLVPGHYGFRVATERMGVPAEAVVQMSNFVGYLLEEVAYRNIGQVLLIGHIGKLIKVAGGIFHTHNRVADARLEILLAHAALNGIPPTTLNYLANLATAEEAANELLELGGQPVIHHLAHLASKRSKEYLRDYSLNVGTIFTNLKGEVIGWDDEAKKIVAGEGWAWPA